MSPSLGRQWIPRPRTAVVLATDTDETVRPVIRRLGEQAVKHRLEVVIVAPLSPGALDTHRQELDGFAAVRLVPVAPSVGLAAARAVGIRAATAPVVFIGETHTYPQPGWAAALLAAFEGPWATVVPAITNANPSGPVSWAAYVSDYGRWGEGRAQGEIPEALIYNAAYRRHVLVELGRRARGRARHLFGGAVARRSAAAATAPTSSPARASRTSTWDAWGPTSTRSCWPGSSSAPCAPRGGRGGGGCSTSSPRPSSRSCWWPACGNRRVGSAARGACRSARGR